MSRIILPSVLAADFANLGEQIQRVEAAGADMHHVDVMDGHFVPNISFGPVVVDAVAKVATLPLDLHLMIANPEQYLKDYYQYNPAYITIHAEIDGDVAALLQEIRANGSKAGLSIKPGTPFESIQPLLPYVDMLLIMTVEPGFGGQSFMHDMVPKIAEAKTYIDANQLPIEIEVDGGVDTKTITECADAGATLFVAGSSVYGSDDYAATIEALHHV